MAEEFRRARAASGIARVFTGLVAGVALIAGLIVAAPASSASAFSGSEFDPGYIISDAQFYAGDALTESEIQAFLEYKRPTCAAGYVCLPQYRMDTQSKAADPMCSGYTGASQELASRIIAKVALACGISPKVLLVMLQKEQSLLTDSSPSAYQYRAAMGAGCPDTAGCDPAQAGFFQQVYFAAWYLKRYAGPPGTGPGTEYTSTFNAYAKFSNYAPGANFNILYNPNYGCGTKTVYIRNQPTASLYTYTPYTPNAAALANLGGTGDGCSSYGNRNFWSYYYSWFGNPTGIVPAGVDVTRIEGIDRFDTSVKISQASGSATGGTVYIASGMNFPDALSAAPAATLVGAPLLLVRTTSIPDAVKAELVRLAPALIVVVGGESSVSAETATDLENYAATVRRDSGDNRYATSVAVADAAFSSSTTAYIATGQGFADALSAGAAAGSKGAPVILVDGKSSTLDPAVADTLTRLGVTTVIVAGSNSVVSDSIVAALGSVAGVTTVKRVSGADRYKTASAINRDAFASSPTVFVASGQNFPDALAGAVLAGSTGSALYLAPQSCIYRKSAQDIIDLGTTTMTLLGSSSVLSNSVKSFLNCD